MVVECVIVEVDGSGVCDSVGGPMKELTVINGGTVDRV